MGPVLGFLAGAVTLGGAVALYRMAQNGSPTFRDTLNKVRQKSRAAGFGHANSDAADGSSIMEYKQDGDGVFRPKT